MDVGAACKGHFREASKDDLKRRVLEHFRTKHGVRSSETIENFVDEHARAGGDPRVSRDEG